jgi:hypothetical protein
MSTESSRSPAAKVMDEAIDLAIEGRSPYPEKSAFIDADAPHVGDEIRDAADEGLAVVLVAADGSTTILRPELATN